MEREAKKCALVLSGGGVFAAYQVGAWNVFSGALKPDLVVGTSAGALNAWAIASRCNPSDLQDRWLNSSLGSIGSMICWRWPTLSTPAVLDIRRLRSGVYEWWRSFRPVTPMGVVMMSVPSFRLQVVRESGLHSDHLLASCALPGLYLPVSINGGLYCDACVVDGLNLWSAAELGATSIVAVDVMPTLPLSVFHGAVGLALSAIKWSAPHRLPANTLVLRPRRALGPVSSMMKWRCSRVRDWIRHGEDDAVEALHGARRWAA
jgi:NTE family protein